MLNISLSSFEQMQKHLSINFSIFRGKDAAEGEAQGGVGGVVTGGPQIQVGWTSGLLQIQGGQGNKKKLVMQVWYEYYPVNLPYTSWWRVRYLIRAEDKIWGKWKTTTGGQLYSFQYSFTYQWGTQTYTSQNTISLAGKDQVPATDLFQGTLGPPHPSTFPTFTHRHAVGERYGGAHGIKITWDA